MLLVRTRRNDLVYCCLNGLNDPSVDDGVVMRLILGLILAWPVVCSSVVAQSKDNSDGERVRTALSFQPKQADVDYDQPDDSTISKCTFESAKSIGKVGFIVRDPANRTLRLYLDTNGDQKLDRWSYFKDGQEVYCDIDSNFDGKADQYRWFGAAGTRWGNDANADREIDSWLAISPEEVSAELVAAIANKDVARFKRLLINDQEIDDLKVNEDLAADLKKSVADAAAGFAEFANTQQVVSKDSHWLQFGGMRPSVLADSTPGVTQPITIYDNVAAIVSGKSEPGQVALGTLIQVVHGWRLIELPQAVVPGQAIVVGGFFLRSIPNASSPNEMVASAGNQKLVEGYLKVLKDIETADEKTLPDLYGQLATKIGEIIESESDADEKGIWIKQFADVVSTAFLDGKFPTGLDRLSDFASKLSNSNADQDVESYVVYRLISARASSELEAASKDDVAAVQEKNLRSLERFVQQYPHSEFAAEAMYQLATSAEVSDPVAAGTWYMRIVKEFANSPFTPRANGALLRLNSKGKPLPVSGKTMDGKPFQLSDLKGKVTIVHYWASWAGRTTSMNCGGCNENMKTNWLSLEFALTTPTSLPRLRNSSKKMRCHGSTCTMEKDSKAACRSNSELRWCRRPSCTTPTDWWSTIAFRWTSWTKHCGSNSIMRTTPCPKKPAGSNPRLNGPVQLFVLCCGIGGTGWLATTDTAAQLPKAGSRASSKLTTDSGDDADEDRLAH